MVRLKLFITRPEEATTGLIMLRRDKRYGGSKPLKQRKFRVVSLYYTLNLAGSQSSLHKRRVPRSSSDFLRTVLTALFLLFFFLVRRRFSPCQTSKNRITVAKADQNE